MLRGLFIAGVGSVILLLTTLPTLALSGPEVLTVLDSGTSLELAAVLQDHPVSELYRVRRGGKGLLHLALARGETFWTQLLAAGWPVAQETGWTPQHEAALAGDDRALSALLKAGAPVDPKEPVNGGTPLHVAAFNGRLAVVKVLLNAGAKINARDNDGWTALSQARDQGFPEIVDWLKQYGATR